MKVGRTSKQSTSKETKLFKHDKLPKPKKGKLKNTKKLSVAKSTDGLKQSRKLKKTSETANTRNPVKTDKKKKHVKLAEQKHKVKENKNKKLNNTLISKSSSKDAKVSASGMKDSFKMQLGYIHNFDKLNHHNYSKPAKEYKHQEIIKPKKKTKVKEHIAKPKKNKHYFSHDNFLIQKEKKHKCHSKLLKDLKGNSKVIKSKDHIVSKLHKKKKQNSSKQLKQSGGLYNSSKATSKSLHEQLSKMQLSSVNSSENDVPEKKRKEIVCNGTVHTSEEKIKTKQPNFLVVNKDKLKETISNDQALGVSLSKSQPSPNSLLSAGSRSHRIAGLNATAKVQILLENESRKSINTEKLNDNQKQATANEAKQLTGNIQKASSKNTPNRQYRSNVFSSDKANRGEKRKLEDGFECMGPRKSKRMASMNAQAILAATSSLKPRQCLNKALGGKERVSISSTEDDVEFRVKWSSAKFHKEVSNKSGSSMSYHQRKVVITGVTSTRTLKQGQKAKNLKIDKSKERKDVQESRPGKANLCSCQRIVSVNDNNRAVDSMSVSRVGLTKYTKVTKVHINTTEGAEVKSAEDSNVHKIEQGEMAVVSTYQYQTKAGCCYNWQTMFGDPVPNHINNQTDSDASEHYSTNPASSYSHPGTSDLLSSKPESVRNYCPSNFVIPECRSSSPGSCCVERCDCKESNESYVQRVVVPYCNHKSIYHQQQLCHPSHQTSCFSCCSGKCLASPSSVSQETHCTCAGQRKSYPTDQCNRLSSFQNHHEELGHQSVQQTYPNKYHSCGVPCHSPCRLHKLSPSCHECRIPTHIHKHHRHPACPGFILQKSLLSSHSQDAGCPPVPHPPPSDSAASLAAKVPRPEVLVPQEANLPTEGKLSVEDGSYKCCISCQATAFENDSKILKCVPSCKLSYCTVDSPAESVYLSSTVVGRQRSKSRLNSSDKELVQDSKFKKCKKSAEKLTKRHSDYNHCDSVPKSFKLMKLKKWRRSESPDNKDILCNTLANIVDESLQLNNSVAHRETQKPVKKQKNSKFATKKLCEGDSVATKTKQSDDSIPELSFLHSSIITKRLGKKRFSNGWSWEGECFHKPILLSNDDVPQVRKCYSAMRHQEGDVIKVRDCVLLKSGPRKIDLPFVAKVVALWENAEDGEMMVSLLWYYRPEHTEQGREPHHREDEIFASKHRDVNSVACIEDKCYVLTLGEYCRYRAWLRMLEEGARPRNSPVPAMEETYARRDRLPPGRVSSEMVFYCQKVYDFRQKRILKNPT